MQALKKICCLEKPAKQLELPSAEKLNFLQRRELHKAMKRKCNGEFCGVIAAGFSDLGRAGVRKPKEMRRIRELLERHSMRFGSITILGLSDEALSLYAYGFDRELSLRDITPVVNGYREEVRSILNNCFWMTRRHKRELLIQVYEDAVRTLSHCAAAA